MQGVAKAPKKKPERARDRGVIRPVTVEIAPELDEALEACARRDRRTKKAVLTIAIEEYLSRQGMWPPASDPDDD